ncbi:MAG: M20/M25/M40 family metallo-hydrolase [Nitrospirae bacterium]|jgi:Zn-dependent M28 family amino/carboxypeptidase|nr:M20/M25/M40 family metallo-hydrolase [Nitrospirota bacterium]
MISSIHEILSDISVERLKGYVKSIEGLRHGWENYDEIEKRAKFIENTFRSFELKVENQYLSFHGKTYRNIIATMEGIKINSENILLGAHYDAAWGSPGADDNGSGVAVLLEAANILSKQNFNKTVQFVAFTLEEPQPQTIHFLIGSDHFVKEAKKSKKRYEAVFILESVGYTDKAEGSQVVPIFVRIPVPRKGDFLGIIANRRSRHIMDAFYSISREYSPELKIVTYKVPLSGRIIPETRFSDHASFWNYGYPALMLTDTAMFRNPHYHTHRDSFETLDFTFIFNVTKAVVSVILMLGNN